MKSAAAAFAIIAASAAAATACSPSDFEISGFRITAVNECRLTPCPVYKITGRVKNNCKTPAGPQLQITALGKNGEILDVQERWPASVRNIAPGQSLAFNLGSAIAYSASIVNFEIVVIDARTWR